MKLLLLKTLLQRRARDEGFTLPMVIALGLVMLLLAAVSITTANEENLTAITQNSRSDALAIAEVGVARYRELLDRNRELTIYDDALWATKTTREEVCNNEDKDITSFLRGRSQNLVDTQDLDNDGNSTESIGSYSLVSYDYSNSDGVFNRTDDTANNDAKGILTVQGTAADDSKAQIQVEIPIRINPDDMTNLAPALWIGNTSPNLGNLTIGNGNVVIKDQATSTTDGCRDFSDDDVSDGSQKLSAANRPVISNSRNLPSIQKIIDDVNNAKSAWNVTGINLLNNRPPTVTEPKTISPGVTFNNYKKATFAPSTDKGYKPDPEPGNKDCSVVKLCRYYYELSGTGTLTYIDTDLLTDGIAKTTLLLNRPLTIEATNDATTGQDVKIGSTGNTSTSDAFEIYVKDNDAVVTNYSTNTISINVASGKTVTINGFIHASESRLTITGSGTVNINGSVWVKDFVNTTATVNISPDMIARVPTASDPSTSDRAYKFYDTTAEFYSETPEMTNRPLTGSPTNWKTEEVD